MEYLWGHNRRFNAYANYFKLNFGGRIQKLTVNAGFTCPNRDGAIATGGCTYCNNNSFNPSYNNTNKSIKQQIEEGIVFHKARYRRAEGYLVYFQAYSNTYDSLDNLKVKYEEALAVDGVKGLVIGTRSDCVDDEKLSYLKELSQDKYIIIEYGIESCNDAVLKSINRGHDFANIIWAVNKTKEYGLNVGAHLIFGLPGENTNSIVTDIEKINALPLNNIKFHQLQIIKGTAMELDYLEDKTQYDFWQLDEYIEFVIDYIELLNPRIVVERIAGEVPPKFLVGPGWGLIRNDQILQKFENRLKERDTWQGRLYKG